jgi:transposase-like protein
MQIAIDYKDPCLLKKMKSRTTSGIVKKLMAFNFYVTGAIETIYVSNLIMKENDICNLLNERLKRQKISDERQS